MGANPLIGENPDLDDLRRLEEVIYEFNAVVSQRRSIVRPQLIEPE